MSNYIMLYKYSKSRLIFWRVLTLSCSSFSILGEFLIRSSSYSTSASWTWDYYSQLEAQHTLRWLSTSHANPRWNTCLSDYAYSCGNENITTCTCVRNLRTFLCHPLQNSNVKWPLFCVVYRTLMTTANFSCFHLELNDVIAYLACARFQSEFRW